MINRLFNRLVVDDVGVLIGSFQLSASHFKPTLECFFRFGSSTAKPLFELFDAARVDEDCNCIRMNFKDLEGPNDIDLQDYPLSAVDRFLNGSFQGAVQVAAAENFGCLLYTSDAADE